jgi:hypothetical protein
MKQTGGNRSTRRKPSLNATLYNINHMDSLKIEPGLLVEKSLINGLRQGWALFETEMSLH